MWPQNPISASSEVTEFLYEYSVTMNKLKIRKQLMLRHCYDLTIFLHRMTGLDSINDLKKSDT